MGHEFRFPPFTGRSDANSRLVLETKVIAITNCLHITSRSGRFLLLKNASGLAWCGEW